MQHDPALDLDISLTDDVVGNDPYGLKCVVLQESLTDVGIDVGIQRWHRSFRSNTVEMSKQLVLPVVELVKQFGYCGVSLSPLTQTRRPACRQAVVDEGRDSVECRRPVWMTTPKDGILDTALTFGLGVLQPLDEEVGVIGGLPGSIQINSVPSVRLLELSDAPVPRNWR